MEPDIHRWWPEKDRHVSLLFSTRPWGCSTWLHEKGLLSPWDHTHSVKDWSHCYQSTYGRGARLSLLLSCLWEPCEPDHSGWSRSSTSCHWKANTSKTPEQTHSKLDVQTSRFLLSFETASRWPQVLSCALAEFKVLLNKAKNLSSHEKHFTVSERSSWSPLLLCVPLEIDILGHSCDVVRHRPIEDCFDTSSFECVDFRRLRQIIANLTRETLAEREA